MAWEREEVLEAARWARGIEAAHRRIGARFYRSEPRRRALAQLAAEHHQTLSSPGGRLDLEHLPSVPLADSVPAIEACFWEALLAGLGRGLATGNTAVWHCDCVGGVQDGDGPLPFPAVPAAGSRWFLGRQALEDLGSGAPALLGRLRQISVGEFLPGLGQEILAGLSMLLDSRRVGAAG